MKNVQSTWWGRLAACGAFVLLLAATSAQAQDYPNRSVTLVVPFPAGGGADVVGRIVAKALGDALGQTVVVDNRPGGGGSVGAENVAGSTADGYRLLLGTVSTHGTNFAVYTRMPYDAVKGFEPIAMVASAPLLLIASPQLEAKSVKELIELAKAKPGAMSYGSWGTGSLNHLAGELFKQMTKIEVTHVPYRGSAQALTDLLANRIQYEFDGPAALGQVKSGAVKLLGTTGEKRYSVLPDSPAVAETVPGFSAITWFAMFAPAGTPKPVVELLNKKLNEALASEETKKGFAKLGLEPEGGSPAVLLATINDTIKKWGAIAKEGNIRVQR